MTNNGLGLDEIWFSNRTNKTGVPLKHVKFYIATHQPQSFKKFVAKNILHITRVLPRSEVSPAPNISPVEEDMYHKSQ